MARYMLDTNICIYLIKHQPSSVAKRFAECSVGDVVMSVITYAELEYGIAACANPQREHKHLQELIRDIPVATFDVYCAQAYGPVRLATRESKTDHLDKLIAAHAIALDLTLVTNNQKDFVRYPGLRLENWLDA